MAQWYDEDMPGQECPYTRDNRIAMENYFEGLNSKVNQEEPKVTPEIGSKWRHYNGIPYTVLHIANVGGSDKYPETVVIQGANGKVWTRVLSDWYRSFKLI